MEAFEAGFGVVPGVQDGRILSGGGGDAELVVDGVKLRLFTSNLSMVPIT